MTSRRLKCLEVSSEFLVEYLKQGKSYNVVSGLPADASVVALERRAFDSYGGPGSYYNTMILVIESGHFDEVPQGQILPFINIHLSSMKPEEISL